MSSSAFSAASASCLHCRLAGADAVAAQRPPHHPRHRPRRPPRRLRLREGVDAGARSPRARGRALRRRDDTGAADRAGARGAPHRPLPGAHRRPRQRDDAGARRRDDGGGAVQGAGLPHRRLRRRLHVSTARTGSRRDSIPSTPTSPVSATAGSCRCSGAAMRSSTRALAWLGEPARAAVLRLGAPLRRARAVRAAGAVRRALQRRRPTTARLPMSTPASAG